MSNERFRNWLGRRTPLVFSILGGSAAFLTYSSVYAFRKPFAAGTFQEHELLGLDLKVWLILAQTAGYALSKFIGIKVVSEMSGRFRALGILLLAAVAQLSLIGFALLPVPAKVPCLFLNGLPLGMMWGLVVGYLEGRKVTEVLGAILSVSFILASGFTKSVGRWVIDSWGVSEFMMPAVVGLLFVPLLAASVWVLHQLPAPTEDDQAARHTRTPMSFADRVSWVRQLGGGLALLTATYMLLTAYRDLRDNYVAEIWAELGLTGTSSIFTYTEIPVAAGVLTLLAGMAWVRGNRSAFFANLAVVLFGCILIGAGTLAYQQGILDPQSWMVCCGLGLFLGYVPFNIMLFERLVAVFKMAGNAAFLIYIADAFGYLSTGVLVTLKSVSFGVVSWHDFFLKFSYIVSVAGAGLTCLTAIYFARKLRAGSESSQGLATIRPSEAPWAKETP